MTFATGLDAQVGYAAEPSYGTYQAPTRFLEFNSQSFAADVAKVMAAGLGRGRFNRHDRTRTYIRGAAGAVEHEVTTKGFGLLFEHCLGQNTVTTPGGATLRRLHTIIPESTGLRGKSLTVQAGIPDVTGTVQPLTFLGGKVADWELKAAVDEILKLSMSLDFKTVRVSDALAAATYPSSARNLYWVDGALTVGGSAYPVKTVSIKGTNGLATDRRSLGNTKREPLAAAFAGIEGTFEGEFEDRDLYDAFVAGTQMALVLTFASDTIIEAANPYKLTATLPVIEWKGSTPSVSGPGVVPQQLPFVALDNGTDPIIKLEYETTDTAA